MSFAHTRTLAAAALVVLCAQADAAPLFGDDDLQRNGAVSRHLWTPDLANGRVANLRVSAGVALGLRENLRNNLGRNVAPAFMLHLDQGSSVSLLPAGNRGAMLVLQVRP